MTKEIIHSYLENQLEPDKMKEVAAFLQTNDGVRLLEEMMDLYWDGEFETVESSTLQKVEGPLKSYVELTKKEERIRHTNVRAWLGIAASVFLSIFIGYQYFMQPEELIQKSVAEVIVKRTTKGQKSTVHLKDGSVVMLNSETTIRFPKYFSDTARIIFLEGEAFFEVAEDKSRPFTVIANGISTTALGTSFNIRSYDETCKVSLVTGRATVYRNSSVKNYFLEPGEAVCFKRGGEPEMTVFSRDKDFLWTKGIILFDDNSFDEVLDKLKRWYNVDFHIENQRNTKEYTGKFQNASLEHILKSMSFTLGFEFFIHEKQVTIIFDH
ncbi:MAG: FecR domain-containing protein [Bacteroidota bacterium]